MNKPVNDENYSETEFYLLIKPIVGITFIILLCLIFWLVSFKKVKCFTLKRSYKNSKILKKEDANEYFIEKLVIKKVFRENTSLFENLNNYSLEELTTTSCRGSIKCGGNRLCEIEPSISTTPIITMTPELAQKMALESAKNLSQELNKSEELNVNPSKIADSSFDNSQDLNQPGPSNLNLLNTFPPPRITHDRAIMTENSFYDEGANQPTDTSLENQNEVQQRWKIIIRQMKN